MGSNSFPLPTKNQKPSLNSQTIQTIQTKKMSTGTRSSNKRTAPVEFIIIEDDDDDQQQQQVDAKRVALDSIKKKKRRSHTLSEQDKFYLQDIYTGKCVQDNIDCIGYSKVEPEIRCACTVSIDTYVVKLLTDVTYASDRLRRWFILNRHAVSGCCAGALVQHLAWMFTLEEQKQDNFDRREDICFLMECLLVSGQACVPAGSVKELFKAFGPNEVSFYKTVLEKSKNKKRLLVSELLCLSKKCFIEILVDNFASYFMDDNTSEIHFKFLQGMAFKHIQKTSIYDDMSDVHEIEKTGELVDIYRSMERDLAIFQLGLITQPCKVGGGGVKYPREGHYLPEEIFRKIATYV